MLSKKYLYSSSVCTWSRIVFFESALPLCIFYIKTESHNEFPWNLQKLERLVTYTYTLNFNPLFLTVSQRSELKLQKKTWVCYLWTSSQGSTKSRFSPIAYKSLDCNLHGGSIIAPYDYCLMFTKVLWESIHKERRTAWRPEI